jgi:hypothetical protein
MQIDGEIGQLIFRHEATHILQRHTYDKLFSQFAYLYFLVQSILLDHSERTRSGA